MAKNRDDQPDISSQEFSVEEILAEFSSSRKREGVISMPKTPPKAPPEEAKRPASADTQAPKTDKVIQFPGGDPPPEEDTALGRLLKKADDYAARMFEDETPSPEDLKAEQLLPGVDEERPRWQWRPRAPQPRRVETWPDTPPQELASRYGKGLGSLRVRRTVVFLLALPLLYLILDLPLPGILTEHWLQIWLCAGIHALALILSYDLVAAAFTRLNCDTLTIFAALATLADACTMNFLGDRNDSLPYSLVSVLALGIGLSGRYMKRISLRTACRIAATAKTPYLVTLDEQKWDGRPVFSKWQGTTDGFGSQIQSDDGAMRFFRPMVMVLIPACLLFSLIASVGKGHGELFLWCLSATSCACASFSGALAFSKPYHTLSRRLSGVGSALAGWEGIRRQAKDAGILLCDTDLFPPGSIALSGIKVFRDHSVDKVVAVTATMIRDMGCGLERTFHELLHSQGVLYRKAEEFLCFEGGASAVIRGEHVLVGNSSFMHLMEVPMPQGLNVKNAVFCAIDGELAGIFPLNYSLHVTVRPSLNALISNKISPILATRDFNLIPAMLHRRFKLPAEKMEFPEQSRRHALSDPEQHHDRPLVCILCREGIGPLSETIVGAKRLTLATRLSSVLACIGSVLGLLICFYLTAKMAFGSLSVLSLLVFLLMWLIPTLLISGWVNRY